MEKEMIKSPVHLRYHDGLRSKIYSLIKYGMYSLKKAYIKQKVKKNYIQNAHCAIFCFENFAVSSQ